MCPLAAGMIKTASVGSEVLSGIHFCYADLPPHIPIHGSNRVFKSEESCINVHTRRNRQPLILLRGNLKRKIP